MNIPTIFKNATQQAATYGPHILTGLGVAGLVSTVVLAVRATPEAHGRIIDATWAEVVTEINDEGDEISEYQKVRELTVFETVQIAWKPYIPAAVTGVVTAGCIIMAQSINVRRQAAMLSAYTISEKAFRDYRAQVVEQMGPSKDEKVWDGVANQRMADNADKGTTVVVGDGKMLVLDSNTGQYFQSTVQDIKRAQNEINAEIINNNYASLNDFHSMIGLKRVKNGDDLGWNVDSLVDIQLTSTITEDERTAIVISYRTAPKPGFSRVF